MSPAKASKITVFVSLLVISAIVWLSFGLAEAESEAPKKSIVKTNLVDEAKALIEKQRSFVYEYSSKDIFADIFSFVTPVPSTLPTPVDPTVSKEPQESQPPQDVKTLLMLKAKSEVAKMEGTLRKLMSRKEYQQVVDLANELFEKYTELGAEAESVFEPLAPYVLGAQKMISMIAQFDELAKSVRIYAICWGERAQSVIINDGVYVLKGDNIASLFGEGAPKDLTVVEIKPDRIVIGSKELGLSKEVLFAPGSTKAKK